MIRSNGFSLVELMISLLIGSLLLVAALDLTVESRKKWRLAENAAALEERAIFALTALEQDVRLAGYWGKHSNGKLIINPDNFTAHCNSTDVSNWAFLFGQAIAAGNGVYGLPCPAYTGSVSSSDTLTVRHASSRVATADAGKLQLFSNHLHGRLFVAGNPSFTPDGSGTTHDLAINAWYIDNSSTEAGQPALRRYALVGNGLMQSQEIIPGITDMQITLGIDRDGNNVIDGFVDAGAQGAATIAAIRITLTIAAPLTEADGSRSEITAGRTIWLRNQHY